MKNKYFFKYIVLREKLNFFFCKKKNIMYIKGIFGVLTFDFPNFFLMYENKFLILNKIIFFNVIKQISMFYKKVVHLFFFRLKLRGLGYEIVKSSRYMYRFFFAKNHFYYLLICIRYIFHCHKYAIS